ncbi:alpha/beta hydrolase [Nonomuraea sp. NN258]|nr:alpha/beta hydrolase [Nonomuraea antri]
MHKLSSADGTTIAYRRTGEGPAVVLVAGAFSTMSDPVMTGLAQALAPYLTVISYDRRGRGHSGDTQPYAVRREIEDLRAVIAAAAGGRAAVFGGSSGGALALESAAAGVEMSRLAVFEPPYVTDRSRPPLPSRAELTGLVEAGRRGEAVERFMTGGAELPAEAVAAMREHPFWAELEGVAHTLAYEAAVVGAGPVPVERLAGVHVPTLVLAGTDSSPRMRNAAEAVTAALPESTLTLMDGQAHGQVDPAAFAAALVPFLTA